MNQPLSDAELDRRVLYELSFHYGKRNAINRWDLVEKVFGERVPEHERNDQHSLDRLVRDAVERLREKEWLIGDLGRGDGRYVIETEKDFWEFYEYYTKPLKKRWHTAQALKKGAKKKFPDLLQMAMFDFEMTEVV